MMMIQTISLLTSATMLTVAAASAPALRHVQAGAAAAQAESDEYTRYELLAPETAQFRIVYEVTATTPGARYYFNPIRKGSDASDESVIDRMTGAPLEFDVVTGAQARASGLRDAAADTSYIRVKLARPVPPVDGEARLLILKTYKDAKSYRREGNLIVFDRSLGIRRNSVVLPAGYEVVSVNVPSQVLSEADGRIKISFMNPGPADAPLVVKARALPAGRGAGLLDRISSVVSAWWSALSTVHAQQSEAARLSERAHQDREIVYFLLDPATHAFSLYHDYTEAREGVDKYINVVRAGSTVSNPSAKILDTGEELTHETLKGEAITKAAIDIGEAVKPETEIVVVRFPAVKKGQSVRLRLSETYTDAARYRVDGDQLVWDRSFGRPRNAIVLPDGWYLTACSIPATVSLTADGRIRLDFLNNRPDEINVLVKARKRRG
jgi:hypothetical protein